MAGKRGGKWSMAHSSRRIYLHETAHASLLASHVVEINKIMLASSSASWSGVNCQKRARNSAVHVKLNHILWRWNRLTARRCISQKISIELNNGIAPRMENNSIMLPQPLFPLLVSYTGSISRTPRASYFDAIQWVLCFSEVGEGLRAAGAPLSLLNIMCALDVSR